MSDVYDVMTVDELMRALSGGGLTGDELIRATASLYLKMDEAAGVPSTITPERVMRAAAGLASELWRNTDTIESRMHAGRGIWSDTDMLRINAKVTRRCWDFLAEIVARDELELDDLSGLFNGLFLRLQAMLPETPKVRRKQYRQEMYKRFLFQADLIQLMGLNGWLSKLCRACPSHWWCAPRWSSHVAAYLTLPDDPPDPVKFTERMLHAPWDLSDEQASFVILHRYDVAVAVE